jgi:hypothetical protein
MYVEDGGAIVFASPRRIDLANPLHPKKHTCEGDAECVVQTMKEYF